MVLKERWMEQIEKIIRQTSLTIPSWASVNPVLGGRTGIHSEYLQPLLDEMSEVIRIDPTAEW